MTKTEWRGSATSLSPHKAQGLCCGVLYLASAIAWAGLYCQFYA